MLKSNKGITMVILVITIIVLTILTSISTYAGLQTIRESRYYDGIYQMKAMQAKINEIYEEYSNGDETTKTEISNYGQAISSSGNGIEAENAYNVVSQTNSDIVGNLEDYRYYHTSYIKETLDLEGIDYDFIINIKTRMVILVNGIKRENNKYYALCQIPNEQYNVEYVP